MPVAEAERLEQSMEALGRANRIRCGRAEIKRQLHAGDRTMLDLLFDPPEEVQNALVTELLGALPRFGPFRVDKVMHESRVKLSRKVGDVTKRERGALILRLRSYGVR